MAVELTSVNDKSTYKDVCETLSEVRPSVHFLHHVEGFAPDVSDSRFPGHPGDPRDDTYDRVVIIGRLVDLFVVLKCSCEVFLTKRFTSRQ